MNSVTLDPGPQIFDGLSVPPGNDDFLGLWDIKTYDVTSFLNPGPNTLSLTTGVKNDCLALVVAAVNLPAGAAPNKRISLISESAPNCTGDPYTITATIFDDDNNPVEGEMVNFEVASGPNNGTTGFGVTDDKGNVSFTYTSEVAGTDEIKACFTTYDYTIQCATTIKEWEVCNEQPPDDTETADHNHNLPPDVSDAKPSISCLWPPNHMFVAVSIDGVTDPDGDPVTITVTGVTSDEPTATAKGAGGITHAADATGVDTDTANLRAERSGLGDGRVYEISFVASDGNHGETEGKVQVRVPRNRKKRTCKAVDSGQKYDATQ
ncbi:MAG: Ig-like domain-containing protein [Candidatus Brocadiales bacterium]